MIFVRCVCQIKKLDLGTRQSLKAFTVLAEVLSSVPSIYIVPPYRGTEFSS